MVPLLLLRTPTRAVVSVCLTLFGVIATLYVIFGLESGYVGKCMPCVPGTAAVWQLPATCGVQNYYLVPKFATYLSIDVYHLVNYVLVGSMEMSQNHGQNIHRNIGGPPR